MPQEKTHAHKAGDEFSGRSIPVTQETIDEYGQLNGDNDIIHYDKQYAQERGFRDTIAHGLMAVSYLSESLRDEWGPGWITSGSLEIRWTAPVCPGDTVTPKGTILSADQVEGGRRVTAEVWVENQMGERILRGQAECVVR